MSTLRLVLAGLAALMLLAACADSPGETAEDAGTQDGQTEGGEQEAADEGGVNGDAEDVLGVDSLTWVIPFEPGGGTDTTSRQIQPHMEEALGIPIQIENIPGGAQTIGTWTAIRDGGDCSTVFFQVFPHVLLSHLLNETEYAREDYAAIGSVFLDAGVIRVANDAPWDSLQDLVDDALERPGEISFSTSGASSLNTIAIIEIEQATGAEFNTVTFDGGNPARVAVIRGEVDATHANVYNSLHVADDSRVLAVHHDENRWPDLTNDAPTINEALGTDLAPSIAGGGLFVSADCMANHPERYEFLAEALHQAVTGQGFHDTLAEVDEQDKIEWMDGGEMEDFMDGQEESLRAIIADIPELEIIE